LLVIVLQVVVVEAALYRPLLSAFETVHASMHSRRGGACVTEAVLCCPPDLLDFRGPACIDYREVKGAAVLAHSGEPTLLNPGLGTILSLAKGQRILPPYEPVTNLSCPPGFCGVAAALPVAFTDPLQGVWGRV